MVLRRWSWTMESLRSVTRDDAVTSSKISIQDGVVVVWHDENITPQKCLDTEPAVRGLMFVGCVNI